MTATQTQKNRLIREHTDVAKRIAMRVARRCPTWVVREDLVAAGMLGLTEAAARYDESRAEPFVAFAEQRIRGAILDELRRGDIMPRRTRQLARKIAQLTRTLEQSGEQATDERLADALGVSVEHYRTELAQLAHVELAPLPEGDTLASDRQAPDTIAEHREEISQVRAALATLPARDVTILGLHFIEELTYQQIAEILKVTPSRVCQLLWRAVERLRAQLGAELMAAVAA